MPIRTRLILALLVPATACTPDPSTTADVPPHIVDSLGIRIVTYDHTPTQSAPFRLAAQPRYRHGANSGDYAFQEVFVGRLLPDGSAVVYDPWIAELVGFSPDGAAYSVLAVEGEGPGDVNYVAAIMPLGQDSLLVTDPGLARANLFVGPSVARIAALPRGARLGVEGIGSSGELLLATSAGEWGFEGEWLAGHMARFDMETGALDTVACTTSGPAPRRGCSGTRSEPSARSRSPPGISSKPGPTSPRSPGACPTAP